MNMKPRGFIHYADKPLLTEFRINSECTFSGFEIRLVDIYILIQMCNPNDVICRGKVHATFACFCDIDFLWPKNVCVADGDIMWLPCIDCEETFCLDLTPEC